MNKGRFIKMQPKFYSSTMKIQNSTVSYEYNVAKNPINVSCPSRFKVVEISRSQLFKNNPRDSCRNNTPGTHEYCYTNWLR